MSVLKGSLPFMADLMRAIDCLRIDLMEVSSYGGTATDHPARRIFKDLSASIADEDVLIVEDIIDTGLTLNYLIRYLRGKGPDSLRICTLLDKPARRLVEIPVDYTGFTIPDQFVVGYGLDYGELYRNLRYVGVLRPEVYSGVPAVTCIGGRSAVDGRWRPSAGRSWRWAASCRGGRSAARRASRRRARPVRHGIVVFLVGIASLALVALPYAAGDVPVGLDRRLSFAMLAVAGWIGSGGGSSTSRSSAPSSSARRQRCSPTGRGCGSRRWDLWCSRGRR